MAPRTKKVTDSATATRLASRPKRPERVTVITSKPSEKKAELQARVIAASKLPKTKTVSGKVTAIKSDRISATFLEPVIEADIDKSKKESKRKVEDAAEPASKRQKTTTAKKSPIEKEKQKQKEKTQKREPDINTAPVHKLTMFACGEGSAGELGLGPQGKEVKRPRINGTLTDAGVVQVSAGGMHALALTADNRILSWGVNDLGALGRDTTWDGGLRDMDAENSDSDSDDEALNPKESTPTAIDSSLFPENTRFSQVAAGDSCSFALTSTGAVYGWGTFRDNNGVYGFTLDDKKKIITEVRKPMLIPRLQKIVEISVGADYALALDSKGNVFAWGVGQQEQLGRRLIDRHRHESLLPTPVATPKNKIGSIFAGANHAFAIERKSGSVWAWGLNTYGQTGVPRSVGEDSASVTPSKLKFFEGRNVIQLAPGNYHSVAVGQDGKCYTWGRMDGNQIGIALKDLPVDDDSQIVLDEFKKPRILTVPHALPLDVKYAASSVGHSLAVTKEGQVYSWGYSPTYQCGLGDEDEITVATLVSNTAIKEKKMVWVGAGGQYSLFGAYP